MNSANEQRPKRNVITEIPLDPWEACEECSVSSKLNRLPYDVNQVFFRPTAQTKKKSFNQNITI